MIQWYDIWAAAVAVNGMCVRNGKTGKATGLGELNRFKWNDYSVLALTVVYR